MSVYCVFVYQLVLIGLFLLHSHICSGEQETNNSTPWPNNFIIDCDLYLMENNNNSYYCNSASLNTIAQNARANSHVHIEIIISQLQLRERVTFRQQNSLTILGNSTVIRCTERDSGLEFVHVIQLTIHDITVTNCGCGFSTNSSIFLRAVFLLHSRHVTLTKVSLSKNNGTGLSISGHQGGLVEIFDSNFTENFISTDHKDFDRHRVYYGGSGVFIGNYKRNPSATLFHFRNCVFARNVARSVLYDYTYTDELGEPVSGYGRGGGVLMIFDKALTDIHVEFHDSKFIENKAFLGGGLTAIIKGSKTKETRNITVTVRDSLFKDNGCSPDAQTGSGGGAHMTFDTYNKSNLSLSAFQFINVRFLNNCAEIGGGVYFYSNHRELKTVLNTTTFLLDSCVFIENQAHTGTAIDFAPNIFDRLNRGFLLIPKIRNCQFVSNKNIHSINTKVTFGTGTIYSSQYSVRFEGHNQFYHNSGTALYIVNGLADFSSGDGTFIGNTGNRGGAIALIGLSSLLIGIKGNYLFANNTATGSGGAIFAIMIDKHDYTVSRSCFIQYYNNITDSNDTDNVIAVSEWKANITFIGNRAMSGTGHAIFVTSLYPCQVVYNGTNLNHSYPDYVFVNISDVLSIRNLKFDEDPQLQPQVATEGAVINYRSDNPLQIIPGEHYTHGVTVSDDLGNEIDVTFQASINNNPKVRLGSKSSLCISDRVTLKGEPGQSAQLFLQTFSQRQIQVKVDFELVKCPPGFKLEEGVCVCNAHAFTGLLRCDTYLLQSYLKYGFWMGLISDKETRARQN